MVEFRRRVCAQFAHWVRPTYARKPKPWDSQKSQKNSKPDIPAVELLGCNEAFGNTNWLVRSPRRCSNRKSSGIK